MNPAVSGISCFPPSADDSFFVSRPTSFYEACSRFSFCFASQSFSHVLLQLAIPFFCLSPVFPLILVFFFFFFFPTLHYAVVSAIIQGSCSFPATFLLHRILPSDSLLLASLCFISYPRQVPLFDFLTFPILLVFSSRHLPPPKTIFRGCRREFSLLHFYPNLVGVLFQPVSPSFPIALSCCTPISRPALDPSFFRLELHVWRALH